MWIALEEVDFNDTLLYLSCDTRDFYCSSNYEGGPTKIDLSKLKKYPDFFFTIEEVKLTLTDLYTRSGGQGDWRMLAFKDTSKDRSSWDWKYIRVFKTVYGYLIGTSRNKDHQFYRKGFFKGDLDDVSVLNHH